MTVHTFIFTSVLLVLLCFGITFSDIFSEKYTYIASASIATDQTSAPEPEAKSEVETNTEPVANLISPTEAAEPNSKSAARNNSTPAIKSEDQTTTADGGVYSVPFYSQFADISSPQWKKIGCGIASLAMLIEFYEPGSVTVDTLLQEGIAADAYLTSAGWTYAGLIGISKKYGLGGRSYDLGHQSTESAFEALTEALEDGPVMVSVHYTFTPTNPIPHLAIATGIRDGRFFYNDPADSSGDKSISIEQFKSAWKKRYIEFRPTST